ncbi:hypothetical protein RFI_24388 [Reticulomyxa filosa]|uniref:Uncharacterized protein n=1 Tax=Reticulomyxa filosa TaxID=46433 RepID=X6MH58_RETFI|nr:hypothetical protein RFI_24388 [Reticulomyxa filosa]|eukprot:ETO12986.1 hypothetical protein RFI_24388 [Reticulomyxa filosa]
MTAVQHQQEKQLPKKNEAIEMITQNVSSKETQQALERGSLKEKHEDEENDSVHKRMEVVVTKLKELRQHVIAVSEEHRMALQRHQHKMEMLGESVHRTNLDLLEQTAQNNEMRVVIANLKESCKMHVA